MVCHFCLDHSHFREQSSRLEFCNQYCQIGYHVVHRISVKPPPNPLELKDTIFTTLLQVPPSELFRMYDVSRRFCRILESDGSFKAAYVRKWEITDEFYLKARWFYHEWMPYLDDHYRGFLNRRGNRDSIFTDAVASYQLNIVHLMLSNLHISNDAIRWSINECLQRDHVSDIDYLRELFRYVKPTNNNLMDAVTMQREPEIVELILASGSITDVEDSIRWAGFHNNAPIMRLLLDYQEILKGREGVLKRQKR